MTLKYNNIGILGTGDVGQALGNGFIQLGYEVKMGSRDPNHPKANAWAKTHPGKASVGTFSEAAEFGDLLVLATRWSATESVLKTISQNYFTNKVLIDVTNPLKFQENAPPSLAIGHTDSGGEQVQRWLPQAHVVKAFNMIGSHHMVHPQFQGGPPDMFIAGNQELAKQTVANICYQFGCNPIDMGNIEASRLLEPLCILWVTYGMKTNSWNHAFKLLKK